MFGEITHSIWFILAAWGMVYLSDYYLTIYAARLMLGTLREHISFQGSLELTPVFQKDVDALRLLSPAFVVRWVASFPLLLLLWWACGLISMGWLFTALMGGLFLREAVVHLRHVRNIAAARLSKEPGSIEGHVAYSHSLSLKQSSVEFFAFAAFYLLLAIVLRSWFFLGGAVSCALTASRHWRYAVHPPSAEQSSATRHPIVRVCLELVALGGLFICTWFAYYAWSFGLSSDVLHFYLVYLLYPPAALLLGLLWGLQLVKPWVAGLIGLVVFLAMMAIWRNASFVVFMLVYTLICLAGYAVGRAARWGWRRLRMRGA